LACLVFEVDPASSSSHVAQIVLDG